MFSVTDLAEIRRARALGIWWDGMLRGKANQVLPPAKDRELGELILKLDEIWSAADEPIATYDSTFEYLMSRYEEERPMLATHTSMNLRPIALPDRRPAVGGWRSWPHLLALAASVLLLFATLAGAVLIWDGINDSSNGSVLMAPDNDPREDIIGETLMIITLPVGLAPVGDNQSSGFAHFRVPADSTGSWMTPCCTGPEVEFVLRGEYVVTASQAITVFRQDGSVETVGGNQSVTLHPGDAFVSDHSTNAVVGSADAEPVELLSWAWIDNTPAFNDPEANADWLRIGWPDVRHAPPDLGAPITLVLRKVTAPSGSLIPPMGDESDLVYALAVDPDTTGVEYRSSGAVGLFARTSYVDAGKPLAVYILTISVASGETSTPAP
jgi:hypothetical protein